MNFTMEMAKTNFFDPKAFVAPVDKAKRKILNEFGAYCRTVAKSSIKTKPAGQHAPAGQAPFGHEGKTRYKDFIFYFYDAAKDEVVIGAVLLPRKDRTRVPGALEHGGEVEITRRVNGVLTKETILQDARPHMQPAFDKTVEKKLGKLIENSIVKE